MHVRVFVLAVVASIVGSVLYDGLRRRHAPTGAHRPWSPPR